MVEACEHFYNFPNTCQRGPIAEDDVVELVSFELANGGSVVVEVDETESGVGPVGRGGDLIRQATSSFDAALAQVQEVGAAALRHLSAARPASLELEFGVSFSAEAGAVIARTGVDGHLKVTMKWDHPDETGGSPASAGAAVRPGQAP